MHAARQLARAQGGCWATVGGGGSGGRGQTVLLLLSSRLLNRWGWAGGTFRRMRARHSGDANAGPQRNERSLQRNVGLSSVPALCRPFKLSVPPCLETPCKYVKGAAIASVLFSSYFYFFFILCSPRRRLFIFHFFFSQPPSACVRVTFSYLFPLRRRRSLEKNNFLLRQPPLLKILFNPSTLPRYYRSLDARTRIITKARGNVLLYLVFCARVSRC